MEELAMGFMQMLGIALFVALFYGFVAAVVWAFNWWADRWS